MENELRFDPYGSNLIQLDEIESKLATTQEMKKRWEKLIVETDGKMYLMNHCGNAVGTSLKITLACSFMED